MATVRNLVEKSMRKAGIIGQGESPSATEVEDAVSELNDILGVLSLEGLLCYSRGLKSVAISPSSASYTIGTGGNLNTPRPAKIASAFVRIDGIDHELSETLDTNYDRDFSLKTTSGTPHTYFYDNGFPLGTITLYPVPSKSMTLFVRTEDHITDMAVGDTISLPHGWVRLLSNELAASLAQEYGLPIPEKVLIDARDAKEAIMLNTTVNRISKKRKTGVSFDVYSREFV